MALVHRTTIMLPIDLKRRASVLAHRLGVSLGELVRQSLEAALRGNAGDVLNDPFLQDRTVYRGPAPRNLSADHDEFLYGPTTGRDR
jgi:hypothetical protein